MVRIRVRVSVRMPMFAVAPLKLHVCLGLLSLSLSPEFAVIKLYLINLIH